MNQLSYQFFDIKEEKRTIHDLRSNYAISKFALDGFCAFDLKSFHNKDLPKKGHLLEINFFSKGKGFVASETYIVTSDAYYDKRPGSVIRNKPIHPCQFNGGHRGKGIHRVVMKVQKY